MFLSDIIRILEASATLSSWRIKRLHWRERQKDDKVLTLKLQLVSMGNFFMHWKKERTRILWYGPGVTLPLYSWGSRSPLAAQIKVGSENAHRVRKYDLAWVTRYQWYRGVGILDPRSRWVPPLGPVGTPFPWASPRWATSIHTYLRILRSL